tara:strand:+ start:5316 stop:5564 length:249 start_codon:yes stop_codon:yes gene_type:complete
MMEIYNDWILVSSIGLLFAFLFVFEPYGWVMENVLTFKPFTCVLCLSFWCSLLLYTCLGVNPLYAIYTAFIAELSYRKLVDQ